jgi:hypothetical protein
MSPSQKISGLEGRLFKALFEPTALGRCHLQSLFLFAPEAEET